MKYTYVIIILALLFNSCRKDYKETMVWIKEYLVYDKKVDLKTIYSIQFSMQEYRKGDLYAVNYTTEDTALINEMVKKLFIKVDKDSRWCNSCLDSAKLDTDLRYLTICHWERYMSISIYGYNEDSKKDGGRFNFCKRNKSNIDEFLPRMKEELIKKNYRY